MRYFTCFLVCVVLLVSFSSLQARERHRSEGCSSCTGGQCSTIPDQKTGVWPLDYFVKPTPKPPKPDKDEHPSDITMPVVVDVQPADEECDCTGIRTFAPVRHAIVGVAKFFHNRKPIRHALVGVARVAVAPARFAARRE